MNLAEELNKLFLDNPEGEQANWFLKQYGTFAHLIDDIVDDKITEPSKTLPAYMVHLNLCSCEFYRKHQNELYPIMRLIHNVWRDSITMESSGESWQREQAQVLKGIGIEMTLCIIEILGGYEKRHQLGILVRQHAYEQQHKDI